MRSMKEVEDYPEVREGWACSSEEIHNVRQFFKCQKWRKALWRKRAAESARARCGNLLLSSTMSRSIVRDDIKQNIRPNDKRQA